MAEAGTTIHRLGETVARAGEEAGAAAVAVALHDYETDTSGSHRGDEWFHAASTIKVPLLLGVFAAVEGQRWTLDNRVHVRNQFTGAADGELFRVDSARDANAEVYAYIGKTLPVRELARHMIATSSNLATNLLLDLVGVERVRDILAEFGVEGIELRRGVEDERAFEAGIINEVTADGLVGVLRTIEEGRGISATAREEMLNILYAQEFRSGIPAGLPREARVANKTGEISTVAHDTGLVYLPGRKAYALAILTRWEAERTAGRRELLATISRAVFDRLTGSADA